MNTDLSHVLMVGLASVLDAGVVAITVGWWQSNTRKPAFEIARRARTVFIGVIVIVGATVALIEYAQSKEWVCLFSGCG